MDGQGRCEGRRAEDQRAGQGGVVWILRAIYRERLVDCIREDQDDSHPLFPITPLTCCETALKY
jgi:hypothetical protein